LGWELKCGPGQVDLNMIGPGMKVVVVDPAMCSQCQQWDRGGGNKIERRMKNKVKDGGSGWWQLNCGSRAAGNVEI